jgi:hypothetical protein
LAAAPAQAQPKVASHVTDTPRFGGRSLAFRYRASQPGDAFEHQHRAKLELATAVRQAGQTASQKSESILRQHQYHVALLKPAEGEAARAKIVYHHAQESRREQPSDQAESDSLPTDGQTYLVCRIQGELSVFTLQGQPAAPAEARLVERTLRSLGQRNPLGHFLNGQRVAVGKSLKMPPELSQEMWDFGEELGSADQCELTLREIVDRPAGPCGRFDLTVHSDHELGQLDLRGTILVEANTCRTLESDLQGSFRSETRRGPVGYEFTFERSGELHVTTHAQPADKRAVVRLQ